MASGFYTKRPPYLTIYVQGKALEKSHELTEQPKINQELIAKGYLLWDTFKNVKLQTYFN